MDTKKILIIIAVILGAVVIFGAISLMGTDMPIPEEIDDPEMNGEIGDVEFEDFEEYEEVIVEYEIVDEEVDVDFEE